MLNFGNVIRLPLDAIVVRNRLRRVSETQVENLVIMAEDTGITTPIHCRLTAGRYELIDGAHRLAAAQRLGLPDIACLIVECRQDEARAMEASNNLGACRMTPLQTVTFAASWKRDFYEMHPERKPTVFKGNQYSEKVVTAENSLAKALAESFGRKERQIYKILAVGERLSPEDVRVLDGAARAVTLEDLEVIGKIGDPAERAAVVRAVAEGKKASQARAAINAGKNGLQIPVKDPIDEAFKALSALWARAPKAAKRRFADAHCAELGDLLAQEVPKR